MNSSTLPIGLFDSGVGGLTVLSALHKLLPHEDLLYLGDTARLPYGTKSQETIIRYALQASKKLVERKIKLLVVACNTATAAALPNLQAAYPDLPVIGVVEPGAKAACQASKQGRIGVIATESTTKGRAYEKAIHKINEQAQVTGIASPLLVPTAEEGWFEGQLVEAIIAKYLDPIFKQPLHPDCLVLGCTHFPLLLTAIQNVVGDKVTLVDSAATTAQAVYACLEEQNMFNDKGQGRIKYLTTDDVDRFARTGSLFLQVKLSESEIELIDL